MNSLQGYELRAFVSMIVLSWTAAPITLWILQKKSDISIADNRLNNFTQRHIQAVPSKIDGALSGRRQTPKESSLSEDPKLAFQAWTDRSQAVAFPSATPSTPLKPDFINDLAILKVGEQSGRVFSISDGTDRKFVQVGRLQSELDAELRKKALLAVGIMTTLVCFIGLLTLFAMRRSIRSVADLGKTLRSRSKFDLTSLPAKGLPTELQPLVESFNYVLAQLDISVEVERRFIGDAAHELRTPLAALHAQAHVALHARTPPEKDAALVKLIAVAERITRLSEQLLDLARLKAGEHARQRELADLNELTLHVAREFEMVAETNYRTLSLDMMPVQIECDIDEIGILLRNLVDNALRYTPTNGRVRIRCGCVDTGQGPAGYVEVADDGQGVPVNDREHIFRRFHRVPGNGQRGSGIGLSLVAEIARMHDATIVTGAGIDGRGFSVRVQFPAAAMPAEEISS